MVKVQEFMKRMNIRNQTDFADRLNLTQSAISAWNAGTRYPTYDTCIDLLKMGMTLAELFGDDVAEAVKVNERPAVQDDFEDRVRRTLLNILSKS